MTNAARVARVLQLDRGRIRTLLLAACIAIGRPTWESLALGLAVIVPGAALHLWTKGCLRIGREVTTSGPYRFVRNPFYLATLVVDAGLVVAAAEPWIAIAYFPLWFAVHWSTIRGEERGLAGIFGERYTDYRARVPWLFPWKGAVSGLPESEGFSWSNPQLVDGVEYARLVRTFASPLLVFAAARALARREAWWSGMGDGDLGVAAASLALFALDRALVVRSRRRKRRNASSARPSVAADR